MPRPSHSKLLAVALALEEPRGHDWADQSARQTGTDIRVTEDGVLANRLRAYQLVKVLQAPTRGRQPPTGRLKYILKIHPKADAPQPERKKAAKSLRSTGHCRIPYYLLAPLLQAATAEWGKQRSLFGQQLDEQIASLEAQLLSTRDRNEKKRLADDLQTALHADEHIDVEIAKRVYTKLATSDEPYSDFVEAIDWTARRNA